MSFVDEVYDLYRDQLADDEEDAVTIVLSILEEQSRENMMELIHQMDNDEIMQMLGVYLVEMLKVKMVQDGKLPRLRFDSPVTRYH
ncbi:MAG: DUF6154 family protein [Thermoactinomyces sp.]